MPSTGAWRSDWELKPKVAQKLDNKTDSQARPQNSSTPNFHVFKQTFDPFQRLIEPLPAEDPSSWPLKAPLFGGSYEPGFAKRRQRHVPIVLTQSVVETVRKKLPDSPISFDSERRTSDSFVGASVTAERCKASDPQPRPRHIPIVIPTFAEPQSQYPPTPTCSRPNTPRISPKKPYSCKGFFQTMSRPNTGESRTSTLDSSVSAPSLSQMDAGRFQPSSSTYIADMNSSQSSLTQMAQDVQQSMDQQSRPVRVGDPSPYIGISSPAGAQQSQPINGTTNLSGLVCNVHRCTGKEPHALVGATTTILGDKLYVFGGRVLSRRRAQLISDMYELDLVRRHWTKIDATGDIPPPRYFHSICTLGDTKLICYGGMSPFSSSNSLSQGNGQDSQPEVVVMSDIHIYDAPSQRWTHVATTETPQGRYAHCATVLPSKAVFTSANAPLSAIHHNPASANPNQGTIGVALDGTGGAEMIVVGGQDSANHYIEQISVFNLRSLRWTSTSTLGKSCGAYRSVVASLTTMPASKIGAASAQADISEDSIGAGEEGDAESLMLIYSNYNFLDVKLELQVRTADGSLAEKPMHGQFNPPGLRFPNGGVLDNHFVVSGTYLTSSKQEYALWALDLKSLTWSRIDVGGGVFSQGSWNRGILWPRRNTFVILGNRKRSLVEDYNHRRINFSNVCMVELEAFGLYDNPRRANPMSSFPSISAPILPPSLTFKSSSANGPYSTAAVALGQQAMYIRELADMDLLAIGGERIPVNSQLLARRWGPYFVQLLRDSASSNPTSNHPTETTSSSSDVSTLRPSLHPSASIASRNSSITITPSINTVHTASTGTTSLLSPTNGVPINPNPTPTKLELALLPPTPHTLPAASRPRQLYLPHTPLTLRSLVHYLYTASLPPPTSPLCTPQILCSLLQLARPYRVSGLLEAVVERLHQVLDGRNAAAVFNAAAMAAGGGRGVGSAFGKEGEMDDSVELDEVAISGGGLTARRTRSDSIPLTTTTNNHIYPQQQQPPSPATSDDDARSEVSRSTVSSSVAESTEGSGSGYMSARSAPSVDGGADEEVWAGGVSCVVGLQKRGLRGLMEGRRMRERNGSGGGGGGTRVNGVGGGAVGLGIV
ncbi:MAG: hypothetical protein Q9195_003068 [Heterodermia aff. obscurata]